MDRSDLEPAHRLRQDLARLHQLLRRTHVAPLAIDGAKELSQRFRSHVARARFGDPAQMEEAAAYLRQLDERSVSQGCAARLYSARFRDDAASVVASFSDSHQTLGSARGVK